MEGEAYDTEISYYSAIELLCTYHWTDKTVFSHKYRCVKLFKHKWKCKGLNPIVVFARNIKTVVPTVCVCAVSSINITLHLADAFIQATYNKCIQPWGYKPRTTRIKKVQISSRKPNYKVPFVLVRTSRPHGDQSLVLKGSNLTSEVLVLDQ